MTNERICFDRVTTVRRTAVIVFGDGCCRVDAEEAEFTARWDSEGKVTISQQNRTATAPLGRDRLHEFLARINDRYICAALEIFREAMAQLSAVQWAEDEGLDDELARRRRAAE